jgi:hypothetical protein
MALGGSPQGRSTAPVPMLLKEEFCLFNPPAEAAPCSFHLHRIQRRTSIASVAKERTEVCKLEPVLREFKPRPICSNEREVATPQSK